MRQVVLDTETTGLDPKSGHRIIEIGCIEILNRKITNSRYHQYINPEREIDPGAVEVHGLTTDFLSSKPLFTEIVDDFMEFIRDAELIIHNAPFDVGFIDAELAQLGADWSNTGSYCSVIDTLTLARDLHPGQRNSLDALCRRYEIDNAHRELHGALLDAELLADVYLHMTGGQVDMGLDPEEKARSSDMGVAAALKADRGQLTVIQPNAAELDAHKQMLVLLEESSEQGCLWRDIVGN